MRALLDLLGNPHERVRLIHVAGSKGKGSTSAMLAAILRRAGYRTGLFTSPHLSRVEERFQIDGQPILPETLTALMTEIRDALAGQAQAPTFFELATALGFLYFARRRVEVAVIEVGLGGRFDSTNVCRPLVSIITSISFDHTQQLGDRLDQIAMEKAGIIKPGVPAISGATPPEARQMIESISKERNAPLLELGRDFHYGYEPGRVAAEAAQDRRPRVRIETARQTWPEMELALLGEHQAANAAVAVVCIERLRAAGLHIPSAAVAEEFARVSWPARLEVVGRRPLVVLDCAHNVASAECLCDTLRDSFPPGRRRLIFAGSSDKDLAGMLRVLAPHFTHIYFTRFGNSPRGEPVEQLAHMLEKFSDVPHTICATPAAAWEAARGAAGPDELICITGSVFLAGELRPLLVEQFV
jgi:dihydrofolate synthase/folylpolyglutamate synthase